MRPAQDRGLLMPLALAWCLLTTVNGLFAQTPVVQCPNAAQLDARTTSICEEVLPLNGKIYYRTQGGGTCYCQCEDLLLISLKQLDSLRTVRGMRYKQRWLDFNLLIDSIQVRGGTSGDPASFPPDPCATPEEISPSIFLCGDEICEKDEAVGDALESIDASGLTYPDIAEFLFELQTSATACEEPWTSITGTGVTGEYPTVHVPSSLLRHPAVGEELLMFLLLHEIGHGVTRRAGDVLNCEPDADAWAAGIGFNMVYGSGYGSAITALIDQLEDYYAAIYPSTYAELPLIGTGGHCLNDYPKLACRTGLISSVSSSAATPALLSDIDDLVDDFMAANDCWDGETSTYSLSADREVLCGSECGEEWEVEEEELKYFMLSPFLIEYFCALYPHHCTLLEVPHIRTWPGPIPPPKPEPVPAPAPGPGPVVVPVGGPDPISMSSTEKRKADRLSRRLDKVVRKWEKLEGGMTRPPAPTPE